MGWLDEFKTFIARGNVLDLAVGVMIGAAFGKIVTALTENVIMPVIGWAFGDIDFSSYFIRLGAIPETYKGSPIGYGEFVTQVINFLIVAAVLFLMVRSVNRLTERIEREKKAVASTEAAPQLPTDPQLDVLKEILVELKRRDGAG
jgi:large conductance mechanosensitive channel